MTRATEIDLFDPTKLRTRWQQELRGYFDTKIEQIDQIDVNWTAKDNNQYRVGLFNDPISSVRDFV